MDLKNDVFFYIPFLFLLLLVYPLIRAICDKEDDFKTKILNVILIVLMPFIGGIIFLIIKLVKQVKNTKDC